MELTELLRKFGNYLPIDTASCRCANLEFREVWLPGRHFHSRTNRRIWLWYLVYSPCRSGQFSTLTPWIGVLGKLIKLSAIQVIFCLLRNPKFYYRFHNTQPLASTLARCMQVTHIFMIYFNIIFSTTRRSPNWSLILRVCLISFLSFYCYFISKSWQFSWQWRSVEGCWFVTEIKVGAVFTLLCRYHLQAHDLDPHSGHVSQLILQKLSN